MTDEATQGAMAAVCQEVGVEASRVGSGSR